MKTSNIPMGILGMIWDKRSGFLTVAVGELENPQFFVYIYKVVSINNQWPFQDPKLEVPTIYKAYIRPM